MITLLASLALFAGAAQAQDPEPIAHSYDLNCTDTQVNLSVRVTPVGDEGPMTLLYRDGTVVETHCAGFMGQGTQNFVYNELYNECTLTLDADLCADLASDIVDKMAALADAPPIDAFVIEPRTLGDDRGTRANLTVAYENQATEGFRAFLRPDGNFRTARTRTQTDDPGTLIACNEVTGTSAHGLAADVVGRLEVVDAAAWQCTDASNTLDIDVWFRFKNRAVGSFVAPQ